MHGYQDLPKILKRAHNVKIENGMKNETQNNIKKGKLWAVKVHD
jgi:hypothetical protein